MEETQLNTLKSALSTPKKVVIIPHRNPDGDAIGSTLGLCHYLAQHGHDCKVISPNDYPHFLKWIPGQDFVLNFEADTDQAQNSLDTADYIFTLDFNSFSRTGSMADSLKKAEATFVMIDHHEQPDDYADFMYSAPSASSTCEMVYNFIELMGDVDEIEVNIATCLYTGIMTDTGSFRFPSTTGRTHRVIADLIDKGANNALIHQAIYDTKSPDQIKLLGTALEHLKVCKDLHTAYITLSQEDLNRHHYKKGDTEGVVNYGLSLEGIKFAAIFIEHKDEGIIKISLRSKGDFDVNTFARKHFNGGGHLNAAGGRSTKSLPETTRIFEDLLQTYKAQLQ